MLTVRKLYYGIPASFFAQVRRSKKPLLLVALMFAVDILVCVAITGYAAVAHSVLPLKAMLVCFAIMLKWLHDTQGTPLSPDGTSILQSATPSEMTGAYIVMAFLVLNFAVIGVAAFWDHLLAAKHFWGKRDDM
jgi:hypothetical protein